jgi:hypothetical protein
MDWKCDSSVKAPALQVQIPEFKPQPYKTNKQKRYPFEHFKFPGVTPECSCNTCLKFTSQKRNESLSNSASF